MLRLTTTRGSMHHLRFVATYPFAILQLRRIIRREHIHIVHTNTLHALHGFAAAFVSGARHVWHVREIVLQSPLIGRLESLLARRFADRVIAMSEAIAASLTGFDRSRQQLQVLHDGIDLERFHPRNDGARVRRELEIPPDHGVAGIVCRLDHWKGVETFLRAAAIAVRAVPQTIFVVAGGAIDGREAFAQGLKALARELGIEKQVRFTGWRYGPEEMPSLHAALDELVLASTWPEPFGLVVLEAMASGRAVIATRHGGPLELCVEGETALLVPPGNAEALAAAMTTLLVDRELAKRLGTAGRLRAETMFDHGSHIEAIQRLYDDVLSPPPC
jgi:glycosyltransferase involved in cell wall biosynthesis